MDDDHIRTRAYALWELEGRPEGKHDEHWKRAQADFKGLEDLPASQAGDDNPKAKAAPKPDA
jgi:hypothetical protein